MQTFLRYLPLAISTFSVKKWPINLLSTLLRSGDKKKKQHPCQLIWVFTVALCVLSLILNLNVNNKSQDCLLPHLPLCLQSSCYVEERFPLPPQMNMRAPRLKLERLKIDTSSFLMLVTTTISRGQFRQACHQDLIVSWLLLHQKEEVAAAGAFHIPHLHNEISMCNWEGDKQLGQKVKNL